jgi:P4 family phage/plasmid primase-like protien
MSPITELTELFKQNYVYELFYTHVSLIQPKGKYNFNRSTLEQFWRLYSSALLEAPLGVAEVSQTYMPVLADIDLKFTSMEYKSQFYEDAFPTYMIGVFQSVLKTLVADYKPEYGMCVLLEKKAYAVERGDELFYKNGFHIHFPYCFLNKVEQEVHLASRVKQYLLEEYKANPEFFPADPASIVDTAVYRNPWLLYGSQKREELDTYTISLIVDDQGNELTMEQAFLNYPLFDENEDRIQLKPETLEYYLPRILSILPHGREVQSMKTDLPIVLRALKRAPIQQQSERTEADIASQLDVAKSMLEMMSVERADDRNDWMTVGWALYNISEGDERGLDLWLSFSKKSPKFNEAQCIYEWNYMEKRDITLGTLRFFAMTDSPEQYEQYIFECNQKKVNCALCVTHYDIGMMLYTQYGDRYAFTGSCWYMFTDHHWESILDGIELRKKISTEIVEFYETIKQNMFMEQAKNSRDKVKTDAILDQIKFVEKIIANLKTTTFKNNVMKECQEIFYDAQFEKKLNSNAYVIGFKNGVYDLKSNAFRDGRPDDYISLQMAIPYVAYTETDDLVMDVHNFLEKVFPDRSVRKYFLDIMSELFVGYNHRKHVYFWTGSGDNGKSITQMFFERMFGRLSIKTPTSLITSKRPGSGNAHAELARAGQGVRAMFMEEPDPDEEIHTGLFKQLSGNDSFWARDLYEKGKDAVEIKPMFKMFVICNKLPKIKKGGDTATWNRIRVIPFESTFTKTPPATFEQQLREKHFPVDPNFSQKIPFLVEAFAWVLIQHRLKPRLGEDPPKVVAATNRYKMTNDYFHQFFVAMLVEDPDASIKSNELYIRYKDWISEHLPGSRAPASFEFEEYFTSKWGPLDESGRWFGWTYKRPVGGEGQFENPLLNDLL